MYKNEKRFELFHINCKTPGQINQILFFNFLKLIKYISDQSAYKLFIIEFDTGTSYNYIYNFIRQ
jgi:hypothetical protein